MTKLPQRILVTPLADGIWACNNEITPGKSHHEGLGHTFQAAIGDWLIRNQHQLGTQVHEREAAQNPLGRKCVRRIRASEPSPTASPPLSLRYLHRWLESEIAKYEAVLAAPIAPLSPEWGIADMAKEAVSRVAAAATIKAYRDLIAATVRGE